MRPNTTQQPTIAPKRAIAAERQRRWAGDHPMRATVRVRHLESQEAKRAWMHTLRDVIYYVVQVIFLLAGAWLYLLLSCDDPSTVDDSLIGPSMGVCMVLAMPLLGLVMAGARPAPLASALIPPLVIFALPWRDVHYAAIPTLVWLVLHAVVVIFCIIRRPTSHSSRRAATRATARPEHPSAARG